jgi:hypothetical protein
MAAARPPAWKAHPVLVLPLETLSTVCEFLELKDALALRRAHPRLQHAGRLALRLPRLCPFRHRLTATAVLPDAGRLDLEHAYHDPSVWRACLLDPALRPRAVAIREANLPLSVLAEAAPRWKLAAAVVLERALLVEWDTPPVLPVLAWWPRARHLSLRDNGVDVSLETLARLCLLPGLEFLDLGGNRLTLTQASPDGLPAGESGLRELRLEGLELGEEAAGAFFRRVRFPRLKAMAVCARDYALVPPELVAVATWSGLARELLPRPRRCRSLVLDDGFPDNVERLVECLQGMDCLERLGTARWSAAKVRALADRLAASPWKLPIRRWDTPLLADADADAVLHYLCHCPRVTHIGRLAPSYGCLYALHLFPRELVELDVAGAGLGRLACVELFRWLYRLPGLRALDVSGNDAVDDGVMRCFQLPGRTRRFRLAYHCTSTSPWVLQDVLGNCNGQLHSVSAMGPYDGAAQVDHVLEALCLDAELLLPGTILLPHYIVMGIAGLAWSLLRETKCCDVASLEDRRGP